MGAPVLMFPKQPEELGHRRAHGSDTYRDQPSKQPTHDTHSKKRVAAALDSNRRGEAWFGAVACLRPACHVQQLTQRFKHIRIRWPSIRNRGHGQVMAKHSAVTYRAEQLSCLSTAHMRRKCLARRRTHGCLEMWRSLAWYRGCGIEIASSLWYRGLAS